MFTRVRGCCKSSSSFHMRLILHRTRDPLSRTSRIILPRSPHVRTTWRSYSGSASSLAARNRVQSRGRNLHLCRSTTAFTPTSPIASCSLFSARHKHHERKFSSTSSAMTATKIDGTAIAKSIRERLHAEIENTQKTNPRYKPSLKIIQGSSHLRTEEITRADLAFYSR